MRQLVTMRTKAGYLAWWKCVECEWEGEMVAMEGSRNPAEGAVSEIETFCPECGLEAKYAVQ